MLTLSTQPAKLHIRVAHPTKMRRYDIVSGILLILSIIHFTLASPVLVKGKRQTRVDVLHRPKDVMTTLGKRGWEPGELEKLVEDFFNTGLKPIDSSDGHAPPSSMPPGPHGSMNVEQGPGPNQAPSTANPALLNEPPSPSSVQGAWGDPLSEEGRWPYKGEDGFLYYHTPGSSEYGSDHETTEAHAQQPNPNPEMAEDSYSDWNYWTRPPLLKPLWPSPEDFGQAYENQVDHVHQPNPGPSADSDFDRSHWVNHEDPASPGQNQAQHVEQPNPGLSADPDFDWEHWANHEDPPPPRPVSSKPPNPKPLKKLGLKLKKWANRWKNLINLRRPRPGSSKPGPPIPPSNPRLTTTLDSDRDSMAAPQRPPYPLSPTENHSDGGSLATPPPPDVLSPKDQEPETEVPPPTPELTNPELQPSSADSQLVDPQAQAANYAAKGKAKVPFSDSTFEVGSTSQSGFKPAGRSLEPGELGGVHYA